MNNKSIIFRGKRTDDGEWIYGYYFKLNINNTESHFILSESHFAVGYEIFKINPETIGKYIGLTDKNFNKIFEGDIVTNYKGVMGYICFLQQEMGYVLVESNSDTRISHLLGERYGNFDVSFEIIGNIYDNPYLIKR